MENCAPQRSADWLASSRTALIAWWLPKLAILAALPAPASVRVPMWIAALAWMGSACLLNARRCGRTHCRYTGPFYLAMIAPTVLLGFGVVPAGLVAWAILAAAILAGGMIIWWATERVWGAFSRFPQMGLASGAMDTSALVDRQKARHPSVPGLRQLAAGSPASPKDHSHHGG